MKIFVILVARTWTCGNWDPQPCDFRRWWKDNWWSSASETFNFASNNWEKGSPRPSPDFKNGLSI